MDRQPRRIGRTGPSRRRDDHRGRISLYLIDRTWFIRRQQQISLFYKIDCSPLLKGQAFIL